jgi:hypothetical protein
MDATKVIVGREWANRTIFVKVSRDEAGIEASIALVDFIAALIVEVGSPTLIMTKASLEKSLLEAAETLVTQMKRETVAVA